MTFSNKNITSREQSGKLSTDKSNAKFKKPTQGLLKRIAEGHYRNSSGRDSNSFSDKLLLKVMSDETQAQKRIRQCNKNREYNSNQKWTEDVLNGTIDLSV